MLPCLGYADVLSSTTAIALTSKVTPYKIALFEVERDFSEYDQVSAFQSWGMPSRNTTLRTFLFLLEPKSPPPPVGI